MGLKINLMPPRWLRRARITLKPKDLALAAALATGRATTNDILAKGAELAHLTPPDLPAERIDMLRKLSSRKFWLTLAAVVTALSTAAAGEQAWSQAVWQALAAILAYLGIEGLVDAKNAGAAQ